MASWRLYFINGSSGSQIAGHSIRKQSYDRRAAHSKACQAVVGHYLPVGLFLHSGYSIEAANSSRLNLSFTETTVTEATAR